MVATYFLAAYIGSTVPTLGLGILNQTLGTTSSTLILFAVIVVITLVGSSLASRRAPRS